MKTNDLNLRECIIDHIKFGRVDEHQYNVDLIVFSHLLYPIAGYEDAFVAFEFNNN